jgi:COP9 signalosome complex subunit 1
MLQVLATNERDLRLDMHLSPHVATLMRRLNEVAVLQYFKPYVAVSIPRMAESLALEPQVLEQQLVQLIANGRLQAQIDAQSRVLRARNTDERSVTFQDAIAAAAQHIRDTKSLLHRMVGRELAGDGRVDVAC